MTALPKDKVKTLRTSHLKPTLGCSLCRSSSTSPGTFACLRGSASSSACTFTLARRCRGARSSSRPLALALSGWCRFPASCRRRRRGRCTTSGRGRRGRLAASTTSTTGVLALALALSRRSFSTGPSTGITFRRRGGSTSARTGTSISPFAFASATFLGRRRHSSTRSTSSLLTLGGRCLAVLIAGINALQPVARPDVGSSRELPVTGASVIDYDMVDFGLPRLKSLNCVGIRHGHGFGRNGEGQGQGGEILEMHGGR